MLMGTVSKEKFLSRIIRHGVLSHLQLMSIVLPHRTVCEEQLLLILEHTSSLDTSFNKRMPEYTDKKKKGLAPDVIFLKGNVLIQTN